MESLYLSAVRGLVTADIFRDVERTVYGFLNHEISSSFAAEQICSLLAHCPFLAYGFNAFLPVEFHITHSYLQKIASQQSFDIERRALKESSATEMDLSSTSYSMKRLRDAASPPQDRSSDKLADEQRLSKRQRTAKYGWEGDDASRSGGVVGRQVEMLAAASAKKASPSSVIASVQKGFAGIPSIMPRTGLIKRVQLSHEAESRPFSFKPVDAPVVSVGMEEPTPSSSASKNESPMQPPVVEKKKADGVQQQQTDVEKPIALELQKAPISSALPEDPASKKTPAKPSSDVPEPTLSFLPKLVNSQDRKVTSPASPEPPKGEASNGLSFTFVPTTPSSESEKTGAEVAPLTTGKEKVQEKPAVGGFVLSSGLSKFTNGNDKDSTFVPPVSLPFKLPSGVPAAFSNVSDSVQDINVNEKEKEKEKEKGEVVFATTEKPAVSLFGIPAFSPQFASAGSTAKAEDPKTNTSSTLAPNFSAFSNFSSVPSSTGSTSLGTGPAAINTPAAVAPPASSISAAPSSSASASSPFTFGVSHSTTDASHASAPEKPKVLESEPVKPAFPSLFPPAAGAVVGSEGLQPVSKNIFSFSTAQPASQSAPAGSALSTGTTSLSETAPLFPNPFASATSSASTAPSNPVSFPIGNTSFLNPFAANPTAGNPFVSSGIAGTLAASAGSSSEPKKDAPTSFSFAKPATSGNPFGLPPVSSNSIFSAAPASASAASTTTSGFAAPSSTFSALASSNVAPVFSPMGSSSAFGAFNSGGFANPFAAPASNGEMPRSSSTTSVDSTGVPTGRRPVKPKKRLA
eukprot:ANDGO_02650.mRNA.1 hypothetical protein